MVFSSQKLTLKSKARGETPVVALFPLVAVRPLEKMTELEVVGQAVAEQVFPVVLGRRDRARPVEPDGRVLDIHATFGERVRTVREVGGVGVRVADVDLHPAPELVLSGFGGVPFRKQPAVFEDQVHEPGEEEAVVLLVDAEPIVVDFCRVGMDVGISVLRFLSWRDCTLEAVAPIGFRPLSWVLAGFPRGRPAAALASVLPGLAAGAAPPGSATGSKAKPEGAETRSLAGGAGAGGFGCGSGGVDGTGATTAADPASCGPPS